MNIKPETCLPWKKRDFVDDMDGGIVFPFIPERDWEYIIHACNAYPKFLEFVHMIAGADLTCQPAEQEIAKELLKELKEP